MDMLTSSQLGDILSIARERLRSEKRRMPRKEGGTWDTRVRKFFYDEMFDILKEEFGVDNPDEYLYVEGRNRLRGEKRVKLFGSGLYPDAVIKFDDAMVAIELDAGPAGRPSGSRIKTALAKAGILGLTGCFQGIYVFFFIYHGETSDYERMREKELEKKVLDFYEKNLSTYLILI